MSDRHLKKGVFVNLGCGVADGTDSTPLENYVISNEGLLVGKNDEMATLQEAAHFANYQILPRV